MAKVQVIALFVLCVAVSVPAPAATCNSLAALTLPKTIMISAQDIGPGKFVPSEGRPSDLQLTAYKDLPAFCRVRGVIKSSPESNIEFEVWLPTADTWASGTVRAGSLTTLPQMAPASRGR